MSKVFKGIKNAYLKVIKKIAKFSTKESGENLFSSVYAILAGILFGFVLMLIFVPADAFPGLWIIFTGAFQKGNESFGDVFLNAAPIIVTGLSVGFAFKTGLFNIGATGQFTVGSFVAIYIGVRWSFLPGNLHWIVAVLGAVVAGAVWGFIPGLLKALFNVHEVVATIMMNYIAMYLVIFGVQATVYDGLSKSKSVLETAIIPKMGLQWIFPDSAVTGGIFLAFLAVGIIYILLEKTTFGYQLKAVGYNRDAARYAGINEKKSIIYSMVIAGALAGLGGAIYYLTGSGTHLGIEKLLLPQGFDGIAVALLGLSHPLGILASGLFLGYIRNSGFYLQTLAFDREVIDIIIASIIYFSALSMLFKNLVKKTFKKHVKNTLDGGDE